MSIKIVSIEEVSKKKETIKKLSIKKGFKDTFSATLENDGYIYNTKYGMFMRFINGILLQFVACENLKSASREYKCFTISGGIFSVYTFSYEKKELLFYSGDFATYQREYLHTYYGIRDYEYNDDNMLDMLNYALKDTINAILPVHNNVKDLDSYIEYRKHIRIDTFYSAGPIKWCCNDQLALIQANNHDDFMSCLYKMLSNLQKELKAGTCGGTLKEQYDLLYDAIVVHLAQRRDKIYNDPELYSEALIELERRKNNNLETLKQIGLL